MNPMLVAVILILAGVIVGLALMPLIRKRLERAHAGDLESTAHYLTHPHEPPAADKTPPDAPR